MKYFLLLIIVFSPNIFGQSRPVADAGIEEIYLAKGDGKGKAGETRTSFLPTDIPIYCVVKLDSAQPVTVKMHLVAVAVPGVKAETKVVSASYTTKDGQNEVHFTGRPDGLWTAGKYRVDIFIGGTLAKSLDFEIKKASGLDAAKFFQPKQTPKSKLAKKPRKN